MLPFCSVRYTQKTEVVQSRIRQLVGQTALYGESGRGWNSGCGLNIGYDLLCRISAWYQRIGQSKIL